MSLIYNAVFDKSTRRLAFEDKAGNEIYSCTIPERTPMVDDPNKPLMLRAIADNSSVMLEKYGTLSNTYQTSTDGTNWTDYTFGTKISLNKGESVYFRCNRHPTTQTGYDYVRFHMWGGIEAWHNAYSMISPSFTDTSASVGRYGMYILFHSCEVLTKAPLLLNALAEHCYDGLFYDCPALKQAPSLPATTLAEGCYDGMFWYCRALTKAPALPATTLADGCYKGMFSGCQSLKEVRISATTTATNALKDWLKDVSATGDFYCDPNATIFPTDSASGIPKGWRRLNIDEEAPAVDDITKPLTFKATQDGSTVKLVKAGTPTGAFQTSSDGGKTWTDYTLDTAINLNTGGEVSFRAKADRTSAQELSDYFYFEMTGKIEAWHNVMSMTNADFIVQEVSIHYAFYKLFNGCTSLTKAPALPATTLAANCYDHMFYDCTSLKKAPELPATTLSKKCYDNMFSGCTSLTEAPELPATTLATYCYRTMFGNCRSLTTAPALPATTLADYCCQYMFYGCTSLTKPPALPATTLAPECYKGMFEGCSSLIEVRCKIPSSYSSSQISTYANNWLSGVSSTGTFYTNIDANWPSGASGIPQNWTRLNIDDYPTT